MKTKNENRPVKGSHTTVDPIRDIEDVRNIKKALKKKKNKRDYLLFVMGINNGLRIGDLLSIKVGDVAGLKVGETFGIREQKTKKPNLVMVNQDVYDAIQMYLTDDITEEDKVEYLFKSRKGGVIKREAVAKMIKGWTAGMKGKYSTHSLRKTWGYHQRINFGTGIEIIMERFNHSTPAVTKRYLGIENKEVVAVLHNCVG